MTAFETLLDRFSAAVGAHDSNGLAALFAEDGSYDDYFFGRHEGRAEIAQMLDRFHEGGERFHWQFLEPLSQGPLGYARYLFSYRSTQPESAGEMIVFEGMARFRLRADGLIGEYAEVFDRGLAFSQLGYAPERIGKLMSRYAAGFRASERVAAHLQSRGDSAQS